MARFSCVLYIHATPAEVWNGIIDPKLTSRYWFHEMVSDWEPGSEWLHSISFGWRFWRILVRAESGAMVRSRRIE
jgi:uncharacterized protein YndB with AHSA1/START domain